MSEWQPIETAPKDADLLLLWESGYGVQAGYWDGRGWKFVETQGLTSGHNHNPAYWMPLPEPPKP